MCIPTICSQHATCISSFGYTWWFIFGPCTFDVVEVLQCIICNTFVFNQIIHKSLFILEPWTKIYVFVQEAPWHGHAMMDKCRHCNMWHKQHFDLATWQSGNANGSWRMVSSVQVVGDSQGGGCSLWNCISHWRQSMWKMFFVEWAKTVRAWHATSAQPSERWRQDVCAGDHILRGGCSILICMYSIICRPYHRYGCIGVVL